MIKTTKIKKRSQKQINLISDIRRLRNFKDDYIQFNVLLNHIELSRKGEL